MLNAAPADALSLAKQSLQYLSALLSPACPAPDDQDTDDQDTSERNSYHQLSVG